MKYKTGKSRNVFLFVRSFLFRVSVCLCFSFLYIFFSIIVRLIFLRPTRLRPLSPLPHRNLGVPETRSSNANLQQPDNPGLFNPQQVAHPRHPQLHLQERRQHSREAHDAATLSPTHRSPSLQVVLDGVVSFKSR